MAIHESFLCEIWGRVATPLVQQSAKVFSTTNRESFSLESFLLYGICRIKSNRSLHLDLRTCKQNNNNTTASTNHTKHASRHSISNDWRFIPNNFSVYNSHWNRTVCTLACTL